MSGSSELFEATLRTEGKRIPTVAEYAAMLSDLSDSDECRFSPNGAITEPREDHVFEVETSAGFYRLMPGPEFCPRLYRGQNKFWENCRPSIFREGMRDVDALFRIAKIAELMLIMHVHPATHDLQRWRVFGREFAFDIEPIAQHYGYATRLLDFSRSKDVAMFFAVCEHDEITDVYRPMTSGTGILYTANLKQLILDRGSEAAFLPLGLVPLPRPDAQRAFAVRMEVNENLNYVPWATGEKLEITSELSEHYYDKFEGGASLFPKDAFDDFVRNTRACNKISAEAVDWAYTNGVLPQHSQGMSGALCEFLDAGYEVDWRPVCVPAATVVAAVSDWQTRKKDYLRRIMIRPASDHLVVQD